MRRIYPDQRRGAEAKKVKLTPFVHSIIVHKTLSPVCLHMRLTAVFQSREVMGFAQSQASRH